MPRVRKYWENRKSERFCGLLGQHAKISTTPPKILKIKEARIIRRVDWGGELLDIHRLRIFVLTWPVDLGWWWEKFVFTCTVHIWPFLERPVSFYGGSFTGWFYGLCLQNYHNVWCGGCSFYLCGWRFDSRS